jgi:galactokinase
MLPKGAPIPEDWSPPPEEDYKEEEIKLPKTLYSKAKKSTLISYMRGVKRDNVQPGWNWSGMKASICSVIPDGYGMLER